MFFSIEQGVVQKSAMKHMIQRLFGGSAEMLLARLVEEEQVDLAKVVRLQEKLKDYKKDTQ
jgi:predicted transcriptional regulator